MILLNLFAKKDLALADYLIASGVAAKVTFQLKSHPTFVSDALEKDLLETVEYYAALPEDKYPNARAAGLRWQEYLKGMYYCNVGSFDLHLLLMFAVSSTLR